MPIIRVKSKSERFRRGGMAFTREARELDTEAMTPEQLEGIERGYNEGMLQIETIVPAGDGKPEGDSEKTNGDDAGASSNAPSQDAAAAGASAEPANETSAATMPAAEAAAEPEPQVETVAKGRKKK